MTADELYNKLNLNKLSLLQYLLLRHIECSGEFMGDLAVLMDTTPANCGQHVQRMEERGFAERNREGQKVKVSITKDGLKLLGEFEG